MKKISCVFLCLVLGYFFTTILVGCGGGGSGGGAVSVISGANPLQDIVTNDSKTSTITINSKGKGNTIFNAVAGLMTLEVSEENTLNPEAVIKISERLSTGSENPLLTSGSVIYTINPIKNDLPIKLTTKPLKLIFTNEDKLSKAQSYYVGIKEIDGGKWQFASLYTANSSSRASIGPKGPFEFNLYKENVYVALFADLNNSVKDLSRVLGINASMSATVVHSYNTKYTEDIKINIKLNGDNLGKLKSDDINVKVGFGCQDKNTSSRIGIDGGTAKYPICDSINKYELAGENFARYYKFSPLSTNFKSQSVPEFSFDLNLKGTPLSGFSNDFVVEICNANDNALPFCYFYPVHFDVEEKEPDSEGDSNPDEETKPSDETKPDDETKPADEDQPEEEPQVIIPANVSLKSSVDDFKVSGDKIVLEFDKDIPWSESDRDKISIDNGAFVSSCEYSNKVLNLSLNSRLKYDTDYKVSIKDLKYVKDSNFTFKTEGKARVSLKSPSSALSIASGAIELEFSKDILWENEYGRNITIDNNAEIGGFSYKDKVLKIYLNNLIYDSHYRVRIANIDAIEDNGSLEFTTEESVVTPVITGDKSNYDAEIPGFYIIKPIFIIDFGRNITNKELALSKIKLNDNDLPQSCSVNFINGKSVLVKILEPLDYFKEYKVSVNGFLEEDGGLIASSTSYEFKTIPSPEIIYGSGTEEDPFQIYTESHLKKLNETQPVNYREGGYFFKQMNDIVLKEQWMPIGMSYEDNEENDYENYFIGTYNGNSHCISGLKWLKNSDDYYIIGYGLFGFIRNSKILNLNVSEIELLDMVSDCVGVVVGYAYESEIENVSVKGKIKVDSLYDNVGGMVGCLRNSTINQASVSSFDGIIKGRSYIGGLVGKVVENSSITNSSSDISVEGELYIGGLIGYSLDSVTNHCCVSSNVCFVKGESYVGGLIGMIGVTEVENSNLTNSFSDIKVVGKFEVGGLIGSVSETNVTNCYSKSTVTADNNLGGVEEIGGLIGFVCDGHIENCYSSGNILIKSTGA